MSRKDFTEFILVYNRRTTEKQRNIPFGDSLEARIDIQVNGFDTGYEAGVKYLAPALQDLYEAIAWLHIHTRFFLEEGATVTPIPPFLQGWGWLNPDYLAQGEVDGLIYGFEGSVHVIITLVK